MKEVIENPEADIYLLEEVYLLIDTFGNYLEK